MAKRIFKVKEEDSFFEFSMDDDGLSIVSGLKNTSPNSACLLNKEDITDLISFLEKELDRIYF